ncbi:MAG: leucyl aminopeptidase, partial [Nitrospinae bacterium]|nr:leucyl aminopeptidase [Nitrospinota bacterium]
MRITVKPRPKGALVFEGLAISAVEGDDPGEEFKRLDKELGGALSRRAKAEKFEGKSGQTLTITPLDGRHAARIVVAGLGKKSELTAEKIRRAAAGCALALRDSGAKSIAYPLEAGAARTLTVEERARAVAEGAALALYTFDRLKSEKEKKKVGELIVLAPDRASAGGAEQAARKGGILAESAALARDLINYPANVATPTFLANEARKMAARCRVACKVFGPAEIRRMGMGGLMAVARGSDEPARFIVLEYRNGPKGQKPIVMVGKGLTFDTGGISLKPADKMHEMKSDMSGAAAVIGTARALAELKLPVNFVGLIPA